MKWLETGKTQLVVAVYGLLLEYNDHISTFDRNISCVLKTKAGRFSPVRAVIPRGLVHCAFIEFVLELESVECTRGAT